MKSSDETTISTAEDHGMNGDPQADAEVKRRGKDRRLGSDLREIELWVDDLGQTYRFLQDDVARGKTRVARALQSYHQENSAYSEEREWVRASLARYFGGTIERSLRQLPVDTTDVGFNLDAIAAKRKFGRLWRNNEKAYFTPEQLKAVGRDEISGLTKQHKNNGGQLHGTRERTKRQSAISEAATAEQPGRVI